MKEEPEDIPARPVGPHEASQRSPLQVSWYPEPPAAAGATGPVVAIGTFDGVHRGHQAIVACAARMAHQRGVPCVALTFHPPPREVLQPDSSPARLCSLDQRLDLLLAAGAHACCVLGFDHHLARQSARAFVDGVLAELLQASGVVAGYNFRFGHNREGNAATLRELAQSRGMAVEVVGPVTWQGQEVSSTAVRRWVAQGEVEQAAAVLGRPFAVRGEVVAGSGRGRRLGFPTANVRVDERQLLPADGVYLAWLDLFPGPRSDTVVASLAVVSRRPTFSPAGERWLEVHALGEGGSWYGRRVEVGFLQRLRPIRTFAGAQELVAQMEQDRREALARFGRQTVLSKSGWHGSLSNPSGL
ncbi:MAG TPA: bifunctional riboflavin kinase/FAD synthetase [Limnochordales bacterium]